jgi:hypothetical protein
MFFPDLLISDEHRREYKQTCEDFAAFFRACTDSLVDVWQVIHHGAAGKPEHHTVILLLVRHVIESLDGIAILVAGGGSYVCQPLLRTALEGALGVLYILDGDTERRALAYQVAHTHRRIKLYKKVDPNTDAGKQLRKELAADFGADVLNKLPVADFGAMVKNLENMLARPPFDALEAEWQAYRAKNRNNDPEWYALFGGPRNFAALARAVKWPAMYEFLYRPWSNEVHAGAAMEAVGQHNGNTVFRPVRHPEQLQPVVQHATNLALLVSQRLLQVFAPERIPEFRERYVRTIEKRQRWLAENRAIHVPWKDTKY